MPPKAMTELIEAPQVPRESLFLHCPDPSLSPTGEERQDRIAPEEHIETNVSMSTPGDQRARAHVCSANGCGRSFQSCKSLANHKRSHSEAMTDGDTKMHETRTPENHDNSHIPSNPRKWTSEDLKKLEGLKEKYLVGKIPVVQAHKLMAAELGRSVSALQNKLWKVQCRDGKPQGTKRAKTGTSIPTKPRWPVRGDEMLDDSPPDELEAELESESEAEDSNPDSDESLSDLDIVQSHPTKGVGVPEKPIKCLFEDCERTFLLEAHLARHLQSALHSDKNTASRNLDQAYVDRQNSSAKTRRRQTVQRRPTPDAPSDVSDITDENADTPIDFDQGLTRFLRLVQQELHDPFSDQTVPEPKEIRRMMEVIAGLVGNVVHMVLPGGESPCLELTEAILASAPIISRSTLGGLTDDEVRERLIAVNLNREARTRPHLLLRAFVFAAVIEWVLRLDLRGSWKESASYQKTKVERDVLATLLEAWPAAREQHAYFEYLSPENAAHKKMVVDLGDKTINLLLNLLRNAKTCSSLHASRRLRNESQHLIRTALEFRISLEKAGRKYNFFIPVFETDFDGDTMRNDPGWTSISTKVCLCLQPGVYVRSVHDPAHPELMSRAVIMPL